MKPYAAIRIVIKKWDVIGFQVFYQTPSKALTKNRQVSVILLCGLVSHKPKSIQHTRWATHAG